MNIQAQQELQHWEQQERIAYETRFSIAQHQLGQEVVQQNYRREVEYLQYFNA